MKTDLTMDLKATPPAVPIVTFLVCYDVSGVNVVDSKGKSDRAGQQEANRT